MLNCFHLEKIVTLSKKLRIDGVQVYNEAVGQFTGLYDGTKWEDLTEAEKKRFYDFHKSEDGETIKYPNTESVKNLWKGKPIFEDDIIKFGLIPYVVKYDFENARYMLFDKDGYKRDGFNIDTMQLKRVAGNIHDNPELLGGAE